MLSDNGPEYKGLAFRHHLVEVGIGHVRIPPPLAEPRPIEILDTHPANQAA